MKVEDLMKMTLGDLLENYGLLYNLECGYYYGICSFEDSDRMFREYDTEVYKEAIIVDPLLPTEILIDCDDDVVDWDKITRIMKGLAIPLKEKE